MTVASTLRNPVRRRARAIRVGSKKVLFVMVRYESNAHVRAIPWRSVNSRRDVGTPLDKRCITIYRYISSKSERRIHEGIPSLFTRGVRPTRRRTSGAATRPTNASRFTPGRTSRRGRTFWSRGARARASIASWRRSSGGALAARRKASQRIPTHSRVGSTFEGNVATEPRFDLPGSQSTRR